MQHFEEMLHQAKAQNNLHEEIELAYADNLVALLTR